MESHISGVIGHMVKSHHELARIVEAKKETAHELSTWLRNIPDDLAFVDVEELQGTYIDISKNVSMYLQSLAALVEAISDNMECIMKEMSPGKDDDEE
jgi:hypothetical protein